MKLFVALSALLVVAAAAPSAVFYQAAPAVVHTAPLISQYHAQDEFGQYTYGYNGGLSAKSESKSLDGVTRGSYSYVDADGKLQTVSYSADALHGFRVAATNLPVGPVDTNEAPVAPVFDGVAPEPVQDTPEVVAARAEHFKAIEEAKVRNAAAEDEAEEVEAPVEAPAAPEVELPVAPVFDGVAPEPVQDTPEVAAAKEEHFKAVELAKQRNALAEPEYVEVKTLPVAAPIAATYAAPIAAQYAAPVVAAPGFRYAYAEPAVYAVAPKVDLKTVDVPASTAHVTYSAPVVQVKTVEAPAAYSYSYGVHPYTFPYATYPFRK